jgi:hypothetical protein
MLSIFTSELLLQHILPGRLADLLQFVPYALHRFVDLDDTVKSIGVAEITISTSAWLMVFSRSWSSHRHNP